MTDVKKGLTADEVEQLTNDGMVNVSVGKQSKTIGQIVAGNVFTYFNLIFAVFAVLLAFVRSYNNMTFLPVIISNMFIGIIQEIRAKKVLDKLTVVNAPKTSVIRDGQLHTVASETLVKGDLCVFSAGNQLSADAILVDGFVRVNESLVRLSRMPGIYYSPAVLLCQENVRLCLQMLVLTHMQQSLQ